MGLIGPLRYLYEASGGAYRFGFNSRCAGVPIGGRPYMMRKYRLSMIVFDRYGDNRSGQRCEG